MAESPAAAPKPPGPLDIRIDQYEGPLDLLLDLIRKQKLNIRDIPIARITEQYLAFLKQAEDLNIDLGGEFVYMAATLIHIKSKTLLPADPTGAEDEPEEDPRNELVVQLLEHEKYLQAAEMLQAKRVVEENVWPNAPTGIFEDDETDPGLAVNVFDLVRTFEQVLERFKQRQEFEISDDEEVTVASRIAYLRNLLASSGEPVKLRDVFERQPNRRALIACFLAVLEMVKVHAIALRQDELFADIVIRKAKMFDSAFSPETAAADQDYNA